MKTRNLILSTIILLATVFFSSCELDDNLQKQEKSILPAKFKVDIPNSISNASMKKSAFADAFNGNEIYTNLATFISVGEGAADIVTEIIVAITVYNIDKPMVMTFESDDDGRTKNLEVIENADYDGINYEFQLTITDAESESNPDDGMAMQIFWNRNPIKGVAILKPYNINREDEIDWPEAIVRIDYSEEGDVAGYDTYMRVYIAGFSADELTDRFALNSLKMFVGKKDDIIDVYGNSNHPNAQFFTDNAGFNWAFVASGKESIDIGVAEVGLPPSNLDETNREVLLVDYSIKNVLTNEITEWFLDTLGIAPDSASLSDCLRDADAPGYFDSEGFVVGGTSPGSEYDDIEIRLNDLTPYNPIEVSELEINFK